MLNLCIKEFQNFFYFLLDQKVNKKSRNFETLTPQNSAARSPKFHQPPSGTLF